MGNKGGEVVKALGPAFKSSSLTQYAGLSLFLVLSLSPRGFSPGAAILHGGFLPREWLAAKGLFQFELERTCFLKNSLVLRG